MILSEFMLLYDGMFERFTTEEDTRVGAQRTEPAQRRHEQTVHAAVLVALESLHQRTVATVVREVDHHHVTASCVVTVAWRQCKEIATCKPCRHFVGCEQCTHNLDYKIIASWYFQLSGFLCHT